MIEKTNVLWLLLLLTCLITMPVSAKLTVQLEHEQITADETVQLHVEINRQVVDQPDIRQLEQDFNILDVSDNNRDINTDGKMHAITAWKITLAPKRSGNLTIPPLEIAGERSKPLSLRVKDTPTPERKAPGESVIIETEVDVENPYIQRLVRYTIRVYYGDRFVMGEVSEPQLDNALVLQIGNQREYTANRDGLSYQVAERQYAIFPQRNGELTLPAPILDGQIAEYSSARRRRHPHFTARGMRNSMFVNTRPVRIEGTSKVLAVQPRPDGISDADWLPAEQVEFIEEWQSQGSTIHVGDALRRTITIRARGTVGGQLPDINVRNLDRVSVYADPVETRTNDLENTIEAKKLRSMAFVPTEPGQFVLPELYLYWWDIHSNREQIARLPERIVEVLPATDIKNGFSRSVAAIPDDHIAMVPEYWLWSSVAFAFFWLSTTGMWWYSSRAKSNAVRLVNTATALFKNHQSAKQQFHAACKANDAHMARRTLLKWAALHWPENPPVGLSSLACRFNNPTVQAALDALDRSLYCGRHTVWNGNQLSQLITALPRNSKKAINQHVLPQLYQ